MTTTEYTDDFFRNMRGSSAASAHRLLSLIVPTIRPRSVVDVGCGEGVWLHAARSLGVQTVLGLDGDYVDRTRLAINPAEFVATDLAGDFPFPGRFDLAISLEVAEHLSPAAAPGFVRRLCAMAPCILFSAAAPGQGGTDHRNEQWPTFWASQFAQSNFSCLDCLRPAIWHDQSIAPWYRQNAMLFLSPDAAELGNALTAQLAPMKSHPLDAVHPDLLAHREASLAHRLSLAEAPGIRKSATLLLSALTRRVTGRPK